MKKNWLYLLIGSLLVPAAAQIEELANIFLILEKWQFELNLKLQKENQY